MVILKTQKKITDCFMTLAWASPFNKNTFLNNIIKSTLLKLLPPTEKKPYEQHNKACIQAYPQALGLCMGCRK